MFSCQLQAKRKKNTFLREEENMRKSIYERFVVAYVRHASKPSNNASCHHPSSSMPPSNANWNVRNKQERSRVNRSHNIHNSCAKHTTASPNFPTHTTHADITYILIDYNAYQYDGRESENKCRQPNVHEAASGVVRVHARGDDGKLLCM